MKQNLQTKDLLGLATLAAGVCVLGGCAVAGGGHWIDGGKTLLAVVAFIWLPGAFFLRVLPLSPQAKTCPEPLNLLFGLGFFALLTAVGARLGTAAPLWLALAPAVWQLGWLVRHRGRQARRLPAAGWLATVGVLAALCGLVWATACAHPQMVGQNQLKQDFLWTVGNAQSFFLGFPPQDIRFVGVRLTYHYLHELLTAGLSAVSGVSCYDLLAFWLPFFWVTASLFSLRRLALLLYGSERQARLAVWLAMGAGGAGVFFWFCGSKRSFSIDLLYHLLTNVNACATALCCLCALGVLVTLAFRAGWRLPPVQIVATLCAFLLLLVGKGPVGLLAVLALAAAVAVQLLQRKGSLAAVAFSAVLLGATLLVYRLLFSAGANNMAVGLAGTLLKTDLAGALLAAEQAGRVWYYLSIVPLWLLNALLQSPAVLTLYLMAALHDLTRLPRLAGERLWLHAAGVGGMAAYYLFDHYAMSQVYFLFLSLWCMALLAPAVLEQQVRRGARVAAAVACVVGLLGGLYTAGTLVGAGLARLAPQGHAAVAEDQIPMTAQDEQAMNWLAENAAPTALFATNRYHTGSPLAGNSNLYTALSGRQAYMEGFRYTISNMGVSQQVVDDRFIKNAILFSPKSDLQTIVELAAEEKIDYLVFSTQLGERPAAFDELDCCYKNKEVQIYRLPHAVS